MPKPSKVFVIPDIRMLSFDPNIAKADPNSINLFAAQLLTLMNRIDGIRASEREPACLTFYLSPELIHSLLINDFPWREFRNPSLSEITTSLTALLSRIKVDRALTIPTTECSLEPDISDGIHSANANTITEWRNLVSTCENSWRVDNSAFYIKIGTIQNFQDNNFIRVVKRGNTVGLIEVIPLAELDQAFLWAFECLPRRGDHIYFPHHSWTGSQPFPKGRIRGSNKREPRDEQEMIWQWDMLHQNHWDVQTTTGNRQAKVTPDGRELVIHD